MKARHLLFIGFTAIVAMAFCQSAFAKDRIVFGGGPAGGTFQVVANAIQVYDPIKAEPDFKVQAQSSAGSVENLRKTYKLSKNVIQKLLIQLHDYKYHNKLHDIYSIILSQTEVIDKSDICNPKFTDLVNTKVLASKNSKSANELKSKLMNLLEDMLKQTVQRSISEYSNVHHIQLRKMIIRVLIYNLRVTVCK